MVEWIDENLLVTERIDMYDTVRFPENLKLSTSMVTGNRERQEDYLNYMLEDEEGLFVVCDGIGGMDSGAVASRVAANALIYAFYENVPIQDIYGFFQNQVTILDWRISSLGVEEGVARRCGTTIAAVYIRGNQLSWLSVGDSRIYLYRKQKIHTLTREHNYKLLLDKYLQEGSISKQEYDREMENGQALVSYLGSGQNHLIDISHTPALLEEDDWIVLCSDGISKVFTEEQIGNLLDISECEPETAADLLTRTAIEYGNGKNDNCSVISIKYVRSKENEDCKM